MCVYNINGNDYWEKWMKLVMKIMCVMINNDNVLCMCINEILANNENNDMKSNSGDNNE